MSVPLFPALGLRSKMFRIAIICLSLLYVVGCQAERATPVVPVLATPASGSSTHPLAGFWKDGHCDDDFGLAIAPAQGDTYSVSFCGPGGCFEPGTYRPNSTIVGDPTYRVLSNNAIEVSTANGFQSYIRCPAPSEP